MLRKCWIVPKLEHSWNIHGRPEQERIKGDKADLIALFTQFEDCPVEELDLFGLILEGGRWTCILNDNDGGQILS